MYNSKKIIIDTRKFDMNEIFERYRKGLLIFFEKRNTIKSQKNRVINEVLEALSRGIPFPPVYVSELQTGELLVLDKSDRLRFLMEYLEQGPGSSQWKMSGIAAGNYDFMKDIFYTEVILYVIDYWNPKYMHMQVGAFIEEWTAAQEQSVRNILYDGEGIRILRKLLEEIHVSLKSKLQMQYSFLYYMMVHLITARFFDHSEYENADKFQLLEQTLYELEAIEMSYLRDLRDQCMKTETLIKERLRGTFMLGHTQEVKTKYMCFLGAWMQINGEYCIDWLLENQKMKYRMRECDMSFKNIDSILEDFRRENL